MFMIFRCELLVKTLYINILKDEVKTNTLISWDIINNFYCNTYKSSVIYIYYEFI